MTTDTHNRFHVLGRLGEGGLGTVYHAADTATGQEVALKVMRDPARGEDEHLRFKQEFRAMTRLRHPNLCAVHDYGITPDGAPFFTMELVPGQDLAAYIPMAPERLTALLPQLARALGYLHRQGLVHGDLKPENVRLTPSGELKLMDMGFVMPAGQAPPSPRGTLAYMAPEVIRGDRLDPRADLYALGAMCYHLLAGEPPFAGETPLEILRAHLTRRPRPLRDLNRDVSPLLEQVIAKMMAREPVARYQALGEVLAALGLTTEDDTSAVPLAGAFVGRQAELAAFQEALRTLKRDGKGDALWIAGGTGTGKSRLLEEFRVLAQLDEVPFLAGPSADHGLPYGPFVRMLRQIMPITRQALASATDEQRAAIGRILPELSEEVGPSGLEPLEERIVLQSAIAHVLRAAGAKTGAVIALDDWDKTDAASAETLAYVRRNAQDVPFLIVGMAREAGYLAPKAAMLPPLALPEVATLAGSMLGAERGGGDEEFAAALFRWTGGHAGHVQRVVAHLMASGALKREKGRWSYPEDLATSDLGADFLEMVLAPLSALTGPASQLAELTAVVGDEADLKTLADLSGFDEETLFAALDELRARRILERRDGRVAFASGGLEDAVYGRLNEGRKLWLHAAAAAHLEASLEGETAPESASRTALARHYLRSRQAAKALPAVLLAADLNMAVFAVDTARDLLRDGLTLAAESYEGHDAWRRDALTRLAAIERWRGDFEGMGACLNQALPLAEQLGEAAPLARLLVLRGAFFNQKMTPAALKEGIEALDRAAELEAESEPAVQAQGRFYLGQAHFYAGHTAEASAAFETAATLAEASGQRFWRAKSLAFLGYLEVTGDKGAREDGIRRMAEAAAIQQALGDKYGHGFTAALQGDALLHLLRLCDAEAAFKAQIAINQELGVGEDHITGLANLAVVYALSGRFRKALETCEKALPLADQYGHAVGLLVQAVYGFAQAASGDLRRAVATLSAAEAAGKGGGGYMFAHAVPFLIKGWLRLGRPDEARRVAEEALFLYRTHPNPALQAQTSALLGEAKLATGEAEAAQALAEEAWKAARTGDFPLARFQALRLRARVALAGNRAEEARQAAEQALTLAERSGAIGLAAEASELLGKAALALGLPEASGRFRAVQVYADRESVPYLRALALHGQAAADPASERGEAMTLEAQQILRSLADGLEPLARQAFLSTPDCMRVLSERSLVVEPLSFEGGQQVFDRVMNVSRDLQGFAMQYGALFKEWVAGNRQLEALNALARRLNASLDLDEVLPQVVALTLELTRAERAFVLLSEPGESTNPAPLICRAAVDHHGASIPDARLSTSVCQSVLASGEPMAVLDATLSEDLYLQASIADLNLRTLMCVPLTARGETFGVLYVDSQAVVMTFTRKDLDLLMAIASHASLAIANATLYAESRRHGEELAKALAMYREASTRTDTHAQALPADGDLDVAGTLKKVIPAAPKPKAAPRKSPKKP